MERFRDRCHLKDTRDTEKAQLFDVMLERMTAAEKLHWQKMHRARFQRLWGENPMRNYEAEHPQQERDELWKDLRGTRETLNTCAYEDFFDDTFYGFEDRTFRHEETLVEWVGDDIGYEEEGELDCQRRWSPEPATERFDWQSALHKHQRSEGDLP